MALLTPKDHAYIGGMTQLTFDQAVTIKTIRLGHVHFHVEENKDAPSQTFTLDLNSTTPGQSYQLDISCLDTHGREIIETRTIIKPEHDLAGMGASVVYDKDNEVSGVFFKFWLPNVKQVFVRGSFNGWKDLDRLDPLGNSGYWFGFSNKARAGDDYKFFVYTHDNKFDEVADPAARQTIKTRYNRADDNDANAVIVDPTAFDWKYDSYYAQERKDFSRMIIYQAHWGTFFRESAIKTDYEKFTEALDEKLAYIKGLGFTAIELLPVHEANGDKNAGYDPSFFFAIESTYGTPDDLRTLVDRAHKLGLAVIFDAVINHLTAQESHSSFSQEFIKGWYTKKDAPWSNHLQWGGSDWGPDPDFDRMEIRNLLTDCIIMYAEEYHVDGIRFDATTTIPRHALKEIIGKLNDHRSTHQLYLIAEHLSDDPFPYTIGDVQFDGSWYKPAYSTLMERILSQLGQGNLTLLRRVIETNHQGNPSTAIKYISSHDETWVNHGGMSPTKRLGGAGNEFVRMKIRLAWAVMGCTLGTPMMFMGIELMNDRGWDNDTGYGDLAWEQAAGSHGANFQLMIEHINDLRNKHKALHGANIDQILVHQDHDNGILAYKRWDSRGGVFLIIINISDNQWQHREYQVQTLTPNSAWHEYFNSQYVAYGGWTGSGNSDSAFYPKTDHTGLLQGINVPKWSLMILKKT